MGGAGGGGGGPREQGLQLSLMETMRQAWADEELRSRITFVLLIFVVYALGIVVPVPVPNVAPEDIKAAIEKLPVGALMNMFGGGALSKLSIFALGLGPYITASIIMQVLTQGLPAWKKELKEGGEYARKQQNKRTRTLTLILCGFQGAGILALLTSSTAGGAAVLPLNGMEKVMIITMWTAGAMFLLWLGEQVSERGIGNGVSLLIFAGIVISIPGLIGTIAQSLQDGVVAWWQIAFVSLIFGATTWFIVLFTVAQRRIPIQHMRRNFGMKTQGGQTSYLPISVNMAGVIPIIFAISLVYMPMQFAQMFPPDSAPFNFLSYVGQFFSPDFRSAKGWVGVGVYTGMIFAFTYFWNAMMYNVEDIADNLKKGGSYIPGIRPGKQTTNFLNQVISRVTFVGAVFLAIAALTQYIFPLIANVPGLALLGGTSLLIMVSVALETMRQIEANLLVKNYEG
jgi:preprotein translocase subunit SecY